MREEADMDALAMDSEQPARYHYPTLDRLISVVQEISLARNLDRITEIVRHEARALTKADGATFVLRQGDFCHYVDEEAISPLWKGSYFPMEDCISGWVMRHGEPIGIDDIYADPRVPADAYRPTFVKSMLMVPIRASEPVGAIGNYWAHRHRPSEEETRLLRTLADATSVAMENVLVYSQLEQRVKERTEALEHEIAERKRAEEAVRQLAISDPLTGLLNRRGFFLQAAQELKIVRRSGCPGLLVFVDLDGLKSVNDIQGHAVGDRMIADVATVLRQVFRSSDVLARIGGDEFAIFTLDAHDPLIVRKRVLTAIEKFNEQHCRSYRLSLSIGLVTCDCSDECSLEQLLDQADAAMYQDKRSKCAPAARAC